MRGPILCMVMVLHTQNEETRRGFKFVCRVSKILDVEVVASAFQLVGLGRVGRLAFSGATQIPVARLSESTLWAFLGSGHDY